jgi:hypothetical protein
MASTGAKFPTSGTSVLEAPYDDNAWTSPTNIYTNNVLYAQITELTFDAPKYSYVLYAKGFDFSGIPAGATIDGVIVTIDAKSGSGIDSMMVVCQLTDTTGARVGTNKNDNWYPGTTDGTRSYGGAADTWGNSLTESWVKDADFGVGVVFQADDIDAKIYIDYITMEVYYTASSALGKVNVGGVWKTVNKIQVNVGGVWKDVSSAKVNVGGAWKTLAS